MILDRNSPVPFYYQIRQQLLEEIRSGRLSAGQAIPSGEEISIRFGVSRMTARQAIKSLCDDGVVYSRPGLGTFVSGSKQTKTSTELLSFTEQIKVHGGQPTSRVLAFVEEMAGDEVVAALHLSLNAKVFRLRRLRISDSMPMSIEESFVSAKLCPSLAEYLDPRASLYEVMAERYGIRMTAADEVAEAALATGEDAQLLQIDKNSPVFVFTRTSYNQNNQPVEFVRSIYRGDRWKIVSRLTANQKAGGNTITRTPMVAVANSSLLRRKQGRRVGNGHRPKNLRQFNRKKGTL